MDIDVTYFPELVEVEDFALLLIKETAFKKFLLAQEEAVQRCSWERCFEKMQQIYMRTPIPKCDFNKVALQLCWNSTSTWVFSCKFTAYFQNTFS